MANAKLYQFIGSPFCAKVRKLLDYKGVAFETVEVDYLERKELLVASGQIMVPAVTFASGETIVDSHAIAMRLEELHPEPTILPSGWSGIHLTLEHYIDSQIEDALFAVALADEESHYRRQGADRAAFWRFIRDRKYGVGFVDRTIGAQSENWKRATQALSPFETTLGERAFLTGRIGLADFALYGQLYYLAITGELKIPSTMPNLRAFFGRMDRISAKLDAAD